MTDAAPAAKTSDGSQLLANCALATSLKVETRDSHAVGTVHAFQVHKGSGRTTHAVLSLGGFLGMGKSYYPLPFELLRYDAVRDLYVVTIDQQMLQGGPSWANNAPTFDQAYADRVARYYNTASEDLTAG